MAVLVYLIKSEVVSEKERKVWITIGNSKTKTLDSVSDLRAAIDLINNIKTGDIVSTVNYDSIVFGWWVLKRDPPHKLVLPTGIVTGKRAFCELGASLLSQLSVSAENGYLSIEGITSDGEGVAQDPNTDFFGDFTSGESSKQQQAPFQLYGVFTTPK